ncbi:putative mitochondrial carrier C12D12.05c [Ceratocystis platani]|uniref:Putative mitochondrial carrier C12D12.05c n=1 Tax=Ceratocystis fimbriata f. sp. platani TaxID=88771 RepID=A0A0F8BRC8_CERFI|nr:putative mitochondrial carrier C12D12.05c [Ceratocystis platani]
MTAPGISQHGHEYQLDSRTKQLWSRLDLQGKGELDLNGLQLGLHNLGHPMKNADHLLQQMFQEADTNRDGKIQFHEFQSFVRQAEAQLWNLFQSIDTDKDGKVDKLQMERAFERAGIAVPKDRLNKFFNHVDNDNDGYISYLEWRLQCETVKDGPKGNELIIATAKRMYQTGGMQSAYRGVTMGLIGMFPYSAIDMSVFEFLKKTYKSYVSRRQGIPEDEIEPGNLVTGMIGASSGAFGATVVYPLNVLRTRLQTQGTHMHRATYTGIWDVAHQTLKNEGVRGLYKGLTPNLLKVAPALSITWVVYENSKRFLRLE